MSDINVQPVNLLKNIDLPQRKKPRNRRYGISGNKADIYYRDFYYLCLQALT